MRPVLATATDANAANVYTNAFGKSSKWVDCDVGRGDELEFQKSSLLYP
jgi:hypothetical protein